ncbi:MAG: PAS domain S-box protein [Nitrospiraceae bacterium]|nr:MAG: PAS domain S-box protein [Nitrospiraceae bacterium]
MVDDHGNKEHLLQNMEEMRRQLLEVETCEIEFQKIQKKYEKLLDSAPDAMIFVNRDREIVTVNAQFETMFGYGQGEIIGRDLHILVPERFRDKHRNHVEDFFSSPRVRQMGADFELYALKKDGTEFPVDISLSYLQIEGELIATAAIRDITKRKQIEEQVETNYHVQKVMNSMLRISLEPLSLDDQFGRILELILTVPHLAMQSKGAIYVVEEDKPALLVMKAHRGFSGEEILPCATVPFGKCLCGEAAAVAALIYSDQIDDRHVVHFEGMFPHGHYCVPIVSGDRRTLGLINIFVKEGHKRINGEEEFLTAVATTLAGVIEHNRTEQEKRQLQEQLLQAEKLAALGRFSANVAHEIRNPLTAVGGFARRLDKKVQEGTKEKDYVSFIISEVSRLEVILRNVLTYSKEVKPQLEEFDIRDILDRVLSLNEEACRERDISINKSYGDAPRVLIDKEQVLEAVENLILNAIDSMPRGGTLTAATDVETHEDRPYVCVRISDTGIGIPEDRLNLIFEPFYTTKVLENGTGLGLSISKKVVESLGGFVKVESAVDKGSTFTLCFVLRPE